MLYAGGLFRRHQIAARCLKEFERGLVLEGRRVCEVDNDRGTGERLGKTSPVIVLTPVLGAAAMTSWPCWRRWAAVFELIRPVPPTMTIFIRFPFAVARRAASPIFLWMVVVVQAGPVDAVDIIGRTGRCPNLASVSNPSTPGPIGKHRHRSPRVRRTEMACAWPPVIPRWLPALSTSACERGLPLRDRVRSH